MSPRTALRHHKQRRKPDILNLKTEGSGPGGGRVVTSKVTGNNKASQPRGEAKTVPKREGLTQVWPQRGLALRLKSPGNTRGCINHLQPSYPGTDTHTRHAMHNHTSASGVQRVESSWCLFNSQPTRLAHCQRPKVDPEGLENVISDMITFKYTKIFLKCL